MGTRGIVGMKCGEKYKVTYNHFDSYPSGLGQNVVDFIEKVKKDNGFDKLRDRCLNVKLVNERKPAPESLIKKYKKYADTTVSTGNLSDWYVLHRKLQGGKILEEIYKGDVEHMLDASKFAKDSLYCEYGYVVNLDDKTLELYEGFQTSPPPKDNPFGVRGRKFEGLKGTYYPIKMVGKFPLDNIPKDWRNIFK